MSQIYDLRLLREYVDDLIVEIDPSVDYGESLVTVFLDPIKDAATAIKGEMSKVSTQARAVVSKTARGLMNLLTFGFFDKKFQEIDRHTKEKMSNIRNDPKLKDAWRAISPHAQTAVAKMLFLSDPVNYLIVELGKKSPVVALKLTQTLLGRDALNPLLHLAQRLDIEKKGTRKSYEQLVRSLMSSEKNEGLIRERFSPQESLASDFLTHPRLRDILRQSPVVSLLRRFLDDLTDDVVSMYEQIVNSVLSARTLSDVVKISGVDFNFTDLETLNGPERSSAEDLILREIKRQAIERTVRSIGEHLDRIDVPDRDQNPYFERLSGLAQQIVRQD